MVSAITRACERRSANNRCERRSAAAAREREPLVRLKPLVLIEKYIYLFLPLSLSLGAFPQPRAFFIIIKQTSHIYMY